MSPKGDHQPQPEPLIIPPQASDHTHTLILLHGLGGNGECFGPELLLSANLNSRLQTTRFVFPTARKRRSSMLKRIPVRQWHDIYSLEDPSERTEVQIEGLSETARYLRELIEAEARLLGSEGYQRIVIGGLSQGCAATVFTLLGGGFGESGRERLGGFIGMSGWLPFERQMREVAEPQRADDEDPFQENAGENSPIFEVMNLVRDILELPMLEVEELGQECPEAGFSSASQHPLGTEVNHLSTPSFIGHGRVDPKISIQLGEGMADFISSTMHMDVTWKVYDGLGHWYAVPEETDDIVRFLKEKVGVPVCLQTAASTATKAARKLLCRSQQTFPM